MHLLLSHSRFGSIRMLLWQGWVTVRSPQAKAAAAEARVDAIEKQLTELSSKCSGLAWPEQSPGSRADLQASEHASCSKADVLI